MRHVAHPETGTGTLDAMAHTHGVWTMDVLAMREHTYKLGVVAHAVIAEYHESCGNLAETIARVDFLARFAACEPGATHVRVSFGHVDGFGTTATVWTITGIAGAGFARHLRAVQTAEGRAAARAAILAQTSWTLTTWDDARNVIARRQYKTRRGAILAARIAEKHGAAEWEACETRVSSMLAD